MRKIAVIIGSKSDLSQCQAGLELLSYAVKDQEAEVIGVYVYSQHRNTKDVQSLLERLALAGVEAIIVGAGWANHLTGCCDAYLRYTLNNDKVVIYGVGFEDKNNITHTQVAMLSISEVPGTKVIYNDGESGFIGSGGFYRACWDALHKDLPSIKLPEPKPVMNLTLESAIVMADEMAGGKK
jgi:phosphoribosylcarboxyaminoimidazole (NCAIR) mutase